MNGKIVRKEITSQHQVGERCRRPYRVEGFAFVGSFWCIICIWLRRRISYHFIYKKCGFYEVIFFKKISKYSDNFYDSII